MHTFRASARHALLSFVLLSSGDLFAAAGDIDMSFAVAGTAVTGINLDKQASDVLVDTVVGRDGGIFQIGRARMKLDGSDNSVIAIARLSAAGTPEPGFGDGGVAVTFSETTLLFPTDAAVQPDGRLVVVGTAVVKGSSDLDMLLCRYTATGQADLSILGKPGDAPGCTTDLGSNDIEPKTQDVASAIALQADGRMLVTGTIRLGGHEQIVVNRLSGSNGTRDAAFGTQQFPQPHRGFALLGVPGREVAAADVGVTPNGRIVVAGTWTNQVHFSRDFLAARFTAAGKLDASFGNPQTPGIRAVGFDRGGDRDDVVRTLHVYADGGLLLGGSARIDVPSYQFAALRLDPQGTPIDAFGEAGQVVHILCDVCLDAPLADLVVQGDQRIVMVGSAVGEFFRDIGVLRLMPDGSTDDSFGGAGRVMANADLKFGDAVVGASDDHGVSAALHKNGRILVGGSIQVDPQLLSDRDYSVMRLLSQ